MCGFLFCECKYSSDGCVLRSLFVISAGKYTIHAPPRPLSPWFHSGWEEERLCVWDQKQTCAGLWPWDEVCPAECEQISICIGCVSPTNEMVPVYFSLCIQDGLWGAPPKWSRILVTYPCPPQYCNCSGSPNDNTTEGCGLIYDDPSKSCSPMRNG